MKIRTYSNKGIHLVCSDGQVFSLQFGYGNYCENYDKFNDGFSQTNDHESIDCEMASWDKSNNWNTQEMIEECEEDEVVGYIPIKRALEIVLSYESNLTQQS